MRNHIKINDRLNRLFNEYDEEIDILEQRLEASKKVTEGWINQIKSAADTNDLKTIKLVINNIINKDYGK